MDSQERMSTPSTPMTPPAASEDLESQKARQAPETVDESESEDIWTDVWKSFTPLLGCLGWIVLPIIGVVGLISLYRLYSGAIIGDVKNLSYESFGILALLLFMTILLSLFPFFLQRSFELTKKARIQSDVWIDLLSLGYWTKLRLSADANDQLARDKQKNAMITGKTTLSKWAANVQALSTGPAEVSSSNPYTEALHQFTKRFEENYGRQAFSAPLAMLTLLYLVGWLSVLFPSGLIGREGGSPGVAAMFTEGFGGYLQQLVGHLNIITAAFLGAYVFSVQGLFRRYQRSDFKPIAVTQASVRVVTSWIVAFLLVILAGPTLQNVPEAVKNIPQAAPSLRNTWLLLGFFTGLFSLQILSWIWDLTVKRIPNLRSSRSGLANVELTDLDGLDSWHQDRLDEAGINYVRGLATADFLDLLIAVRLPCETMVDWVDQAILRMHVNKDTWKKLHDHTPIRTATDLLDAISGPVDHRASLVKIMDGKPAEGANGKAPSFADILVLMEDTLRHDPNIAHIKVFREQMNRVVDHATAYPPNWPRSLTKRITLSKETTKFNAVIDTQVSATQPGQSVEGTT